MLRQVRQFHASSRALDFSKMMIVGRIGSDISQFVSQNDKKYAKYSIASQPRRDGPTNWYTITVFNEPQMNFLTQYVRKGALVYVEADAANNVFEREDGSKSYSLSLIQREINLIRNGKPAEQAEQEE
ncbi:AEL145Wp [Eremothecium gossypii ATCC 10895]|uniref:Single-stranded DNA-binding protein n=1 Tax=Eremothecium gossypii (strain ATCC 10895 / CBS 109.51 / FGSC 9923 / NRRL Y-1056) TaxID=284811 RepID=Q758D6_EREGS|nr:AEL145Wp [Eremothecium gossypii ATCC 10895]AAS52540.2 AEL145Wp [Eremothecium gossypii ATCC 10895]